MRPFMIAPIHCRTALVMQAASGLAGCASISKEACQAVEMTAA
jgi:hypothetical protein